MTATVLCLAAALCLVPDRPAAERLRRDRPRRGGSARRRPPRPALLGLAAATGLAAVLWVGVAPALAATIVAGTTWRRLHARRRDTALDGHRRALLSGLDTVIADLRVGTHPAEACETAARETTGPAADAFRIAAARARLGGSASDGLRAPTDAHGRSGIAESLDRIADVWAVSERHGLALAELLTAARADLAARMRVRARTEAGLAGARATASVLAGLPALGVGLGQLMGAAPLGILLAGGLGGAMLVVGTALACAGLLWTDAIAARVAA